MSGLVKLPTFREGELDRLEKLSEELSAALNVAQELTDRLHSVARVTSESVKRAHALLSRAEQPSYVAPIKKRNGDAVTVQSCGPQRILNLLKMPRETAWTMNELALETGYSKSTLRTYIPTLRRNHLIEPHELRIKPEFLK